MEASRETLKEDHPEDTSYQKAVLFALQFKPVYLGTADPGKVSRRRAKNRLARASRRTNRG